MKVRDVMTREVETVTPDTSLKGAARKMVQLSVSGLPVIDQERRVVGIITEGDFVRRRVGVPSHSLFHPVAGRPRQRGRTGRSVGEVMTTKVVSIGTEASLAEAARTMTQQNVKRLPVVDACGRLAGIISRADIVASFARPDAEIKKEIEAEARRLLPGEPPWLVVRMEEGVATLKGCAPARSDAPIMEAVAARVDGVVKVVNRLEWDVDDTRLLKGAIRTPWGVVPE
jgi:CBS domain-containing protein